MKMVLRHLGEKMWRSLMASRHSHVELCSANVSPSQISSTTCRHLSTKSNIDDELLNPIDNLNRYTQVPLLEEKNYIFRPTLPELRSAQKYFRPADLSQFKPWKGAISVEGEHKLPDAVTPEVVFLGRSNVGKSSLIKALFFDAPIKIYVSKTAGRTRTIQVYQVGTHFSLVDMPGYGENMPEYYTMCVEDYLVKRVGLRRAFLLIDMNTGITDEDELGLQMLRDAARPYTIVLTKCDTCQSGEQLRRLYKIIQRMHKKLDVACFPQPFLVSSHSKLGLGQLRAFIANVTSCTGDPKFNKIEQIREWSK